MRGHAHDVTHAAAGVESPLPQHLAPRNGGGAAGPHRSPKARIPYNKTK
jgi:hypothetical protein